MTLDDLEKEFWGDQREQPTRVRLARVIRALRDEVRVVHVDQFSMEKLFDEILAGAGEEKVAGGSSRDASKATEASGARCATPCASAPATDAAPAVCVWTMETHPDDGSHYETACGDAWCSVLGGTPKQDNYSFCPSCGKPIAFTEANHG